MYLIDITRFLIMAYTFIPCGMAMKNVKNKTILCYSVQKLYTKAYGKVGSSDRLEGGALALKS
jgi:hypothetical protein